MQTTLNHQLTSQKKTLSSQDTKSQQSSTDEANILESFITEFIHAKNELLQGSNPLYALIDKVKYSLSQLAPLDSKTLHTLNALTQSIQEPMRVAIIGQFSSGKSTFLNALLGKEILPSGITPITAKVCHITYGTDYTLEIVYKNGNIATKPLAYINEVGEAENTKIAFYKLYAPLALLKSINFLDTPGFNSLNQSDTDTTNEVLESVDGIIWLTLIDNVGKQSEKDIILSHIKRYASKSLCVLNQKDRLKNQAEIDTSLSYAKKAFNGLFEEIIAISARNALLAHNVPEEEGHRLRGVHSVEQYPQSAFYTTFPTLFYNVESKLDELTQYIYAALEQTPREFVRLDKKFGITTQSKQTKNITTLPRERLGLSLCGADSTFARDFIKLGFDITAIGERFDTLLESHIAYLRALITQWYESFLPSLQNALLQKNLDEIINAYEHLAHTHSENFKAQLMLFAKILTLNYPLSIHLCLNTIALKIQEALEKYTKAPDTLPLFNPSLENIRDELNLGFHFGFLQEHLLTQPLHKKSLWHFEHEEKKLGDKQIENLSAYKERYEQHYKQLKSLLHTLKHHNLQD